VVDLGGTQVRVGVANEDRVLNRLEDRTNLADGPQGTERQIDTMARQVVREAGVSLESMERLVIGTPGPLDPATGIVYDAPNMHGWHKVHIADDLASLLGVPVRAVNDANAAALGEFTFGAGRGLRHMVYLTISTGIGGGVVIDGKLFEGASGTGGEIGHMTIDRHGPRCKCGNIGCLEILASGTSIARRFRELVDGGQESSLAGKGDAVTAVDISRAAGEGDRLAAAVFRDAAEAVGTGVVNCVHVFNPELVVLGGGVVHAGDLLFGPVNEMLDRYAMDLPRRVVRVVPAQLGDDAGLYGALALARGEPD
jgi:glucokinase